MARKADGKTLLFEKIRNSPAKFVHVTGVPYAVETEKEEEDGKIDHIWITIEAPPYGRLRCVLNTLSLINREGGFDHRVRLGIVKSEWKEKPPTGLEEHPGQDYGVLEAVVAVDYTPHERDALSEILLEKGKMAVRVEVWGILFAGESLGVHQIHSRRASCGVTLDLKNRDGAIKLYYPDNTAELLLFKFCGQP